jgi:hypothetical protein
MAFYSSTIFQEAGYSVKQSLLASFGFVCCHIHCSARSQANASIGPRHIRLRLSRNLDHGQVWQTCTAIEHLSPDGLVLTGGWVLLLNAQRELCKGATYSILRLPLRRILWSR